MVKTLLNRRTLALLILLIPIVVQSQENINKPDTSRKGAAQVFIDCQSCDMNYIRQQIPYINYVRDTREAQVYILVTSQQAGSGGNEYTFTFKGEKDFLGMNDTLVYTSNPDETTTIIRENKTKLLKMGLMRYVARTPVYNQIEITHNSELEGEMVVDKWNNWVFELQVQPEYVGEESVKRLQLENSINIARITPDFKLEIQLEQNINRRRYIDKEEGTDTTYTKGDNQVEMLFVKSLSEHWSAGLMWNNRTETEENYDFTTNILPAIEYDLFPYSEATRRQLRILYGAGFNYSNYIDSTIYNKMQQHFFVHQMRVAFQVQEKWGSVNLSLSGTNLLTDMSKGGLELFANVRLRIIKGLSLSINGGISYNNYQPNLRKGEITEADRLLQLKQIASSYQIEGGLSLTYTFGSIYNNVVNPRFNGN